MDSRKYVGGKETPFKIDTANTHLYLGYPIDQSNPTENANVWAIQKIEIGDTITPGLWMGGTKEKKFKWDDRITGSYRGIRR